MKKEQMVGARLSPELIRELDLIGDVEQFDRSTTVRRLLSQAIQQWKLEHYGRAVRGWKAHAGTCRSRCRCISVGDDGLCPRQKSAYPI